MAIYFVWLGYNAALLIGGINRSFQPLRLLALALLVTMVLKVFLFDLSFPDGLLRLLALAGLGLALTLFDSGRAAKHRNKAEVAESMRIFNEIWEKHKSVKT